MQAKLNLGCGHFPLEGFVNVDQDPNTQAEVIHDLDRFPYPFADESFDYIEMSHILEHLEHTAKVIAEVSRILRPGGTVLIRVPHFSRGFTHWDHKRGFDVSFPYYFRPDISGGFSGVFLEHKSTRLTWFAQPSFKKTILPPLLYYSGVALGNIFDFVGNLNHFLTSRLLCFWVGGYEEIEFVFRKVAQSPKR